MKPFPIIALGILLALAGTFFARRALAAEGEYADDFTLFSEAFPSGDGGGDVSGDGEREANLYAFLALIRQLESNNDYGALVMGGQFSDFSEHPALTGWPGVRLPDGRLTTAAGAYQITRTTWNDLGGSAKYGDFSNAAQDQAAIDLLRRRGALAEVMAGNFDRAVTKVVKEWEAFERMLAGNYPVTIAEARNIYAGGGGAFA